MTASLITRVSFDQPEDNFRLLHAWRDADPEWFPERLDSKEPIRERIDPIRIDASTAARFGLASMRPEGSLRFWPYASVAFETMDH